MRKPKHSGKVVYSNAQTQYSAKKKKINKKKRKMHKPNIQERKNKKKKKIAAQSLLDTKDPNMPSIFTQLIQHAGTKPSQHENIRRMFGNHFFYEKENFIRKVKNHVWRKHWRHFDRIKVL